MEQTIPIPPITSIKKANPHQDLIQARKESMKKINESNEKSFEWLNENSRKFLDVQNILQIFFREYFDVVYYQQLNYMKKFQTKPNLKVKSL